MEPRVRKQSLVHWKGSHWVSQTLAVMGVGQAGCAGSWKQAPLGSTRGKADIQLGELREDFMKE